MRDFVWTWRGKWPKTSMCPRVGFSKPSSSLTVVDLPEPFGPSSPKTSPRRTSKSTLSTARAFGRFQKSLNTLVSPRTETTTSVLDCGLRIANCGFNSASGINRKIVKKLLDLTLLNTSLVEISHWENQVKIVPVQHAIFNGKIFETLQVEIRADGWVFRIFQKRTEVHGVFVTIVKLKT